MTQITASAVKEFRERTGLPLMDCKSALAEAGGDQDKAIELLRKKGQTILSGRSDRDTAFGRFGIACGIDKPAGAMVELKCESAPVTATEEFIKFANDLAEQLAANASVKTPQELLGLPSLSKPGQTLGDQKDDMFNRIREVFNVGRMVRFDGATGGYSHNSGTVSGVLVSVVGGSDTVAKDVCMHVAAMRPTAMSRDEVDPSVVEKEREILKAAALEEGKPVAIVDKMVEGRLRNFFAERVLLEQPFVKDDKQSVGEYAKSNGLTVNKYVHWEMGQSA